jgi:hypothetical protein
MLLASGRRIPLRWQQWAWRRPPLQISTFTRRQTARVDDRRLCTRDCVYVYGGGGLNSVFMVLDVREDCR